MSATTQPQVESTRSSRLPRPPMAKGLPFLGSSLRLLSGPVEFLLEANEKMGPIYRFHTPVRDYLVLNGREANQFCHEAEGDVLISGPFWNPIVKEIDAPNAVVALDGPAHKRLRKALAPSMAKTIPEQRLDEIFEVTRTIGLESLQEGETFACVPFSQRLVSCLIGTLLTGELPPREAQEAIMEMMATVTVNLAAARLPAWVLPLRNRGYKRARQASFAFADEMVAKRRLLPKDQRDPSHLVDVVLTAAEEHPDLFTEGDIRSTVFLVYFAGIDTMGQSIVFALYELLKKPELLERVTAEVDAAFANGIPSKEAFREMQDLNAAMLESFRLHPTGFGMARTVGRDFEFGGYQALKGEDVIVHTTATHYDEQYFEDPWTYDLDRYREPRNEHLTPHVFGTFGKGPHACLGAGFGQVTMMAALGTLLHQFELELAEPGRAYKKILMPTPSLGPDFRLRLKAFRQS